MLYYVIEKVNVERVLEVRAIIVGKERLTIKEYCRKEGLSYSAIHSYMKRHKVSVEEALKVYKETPNRNTYYYIEGMSLRAWCINHKSYNDYRAILRYKKEKNCSVEEAVRGYYDNRNE